MKLRLFGPGGRVWRLAFRIKHTAKSLKYRQLYNIKGGGGKNKNLYFYVIGITMKNEGFFSMVNKTRAHIIYALDNGLTPVVNWRDFPNPYLRNDGTNPWEYFFEQPCGYTLNDVYGSKHAKFSIDSPFPNRKYTIWDVSSADKATKEKLKSVTTEYIRPKKTLKEYFLKGMPDAFNGNNHIVACICRGTDYFDTPLIGIEKQPTPQMAIEQVRCMMKKHNCNMVYCATEDERIYRMFEKEFGEKLIPNTQEKYGDNHGKLLMQINREEKRDILEITKQYYRSMYIVSQCDCLVAGVVSGTNAVLCMPNKFKDTYIFKLGCVTEEDVKEYRTLWD